jgi:predicted hotdog family 3-hydroxylacyl-ACP dehydratase
MVEPLIPAHAPATLDRAGIAARIPHAGRMCLLERLTAWSLSEIRCEAIDHRDPGHPLRTPMAPTRAADARATTPDAPGAFASTDKTPAATAVATPPSAAADSALLAPCAIEYAAQAMALHGALLAPPVGVPTPGYLASVRGVRFATDRLDTVEGALRIHAERLAGDARQILYAFDVTDGHGRVLAEGRATVVLNTPLPLAAAEGAARHAPTAGRAAGAVPAPSGDPPPLPRP